MNACMGSLMAMLILLFMKMKRRRAIESRRRLRRYWVHPLTSQRLSIGYFALMFGELRTHGDKFYNYTRMSVESFDELLGLVRGRIIRQRTNMRRCISEEERLLLTLRYLATGASFTSLHHQFLMGISTVSTIVHDTCIAIWEELKSTVMPEPTISLWEEIAEEFWEKTNFPNCIGALDGKHIRLIKPPNSGSRYFNYKKYFSIVLLGLSDANMRFVAVDVGAYGSSGDSHIFRNSMMGQGLQYGDFNVPQPRPLPGTAGPDLPLVVLGDEAFALSTHLLRPYTRHGLTAKKRIFNYCLSRAHRMVECAFGICTAKWRVLLTAMHLEVDHAVNVVLACCVLHNFLRGKEITHNEPPLPVCEEHRGSVTTSRPSNHALQVREHFSDFFLYDDGQLPWQYDYV
ncbi:protein ALP1-like [Rana temporaria]|uniref:protein ALP1-like n=1 Tax=Rana temporaria TaxID=8407 RepID=UPI001AADA7B9|nr:protein ALP1-like [Rana temporaria]